MTVPNDPDFYWEEAKRVLDPILSVMGGEDGGVGFAKLKQWLSEWILLAHQGDDTVRQLITSFERVSRACELSMKR